MYRTILIACGMFVGHLCIWYLQLGVHTVLPIYYHVTNCHLNNINFQKQKQIKAKNYCDMSLIVLCMQVILFSLCAFLELHINILNIKKNSLHAIDWNMLIIIYKAIYNHNKTTIKLGFFIENVQIAFPKSWPFDLYKYTGVLKIIFIERYRD